MVPSRPASHPARASFNTGRGEDPNSASSRDASVTSRPGDSTRVRRNIDTGDPGSSPRSRNRNSSFFLRSSPSRSHLKYWNRTKSAVMSASASKMGLSLGSDDDDTTSSSSHGLDVPPLPRISRHDFEALPPAIQRKYFSELERLRLVRHFGISQLPTSTTPSVDNIGPPLPSRYATAPPISSYDNETQPRFAQRASIAAVPRTAPPRRRVHFSSTGSQFYSGLPDKIKRRHLTEDEQLLTIRPHSVIPGALDEAFLKLQSKRIRQHAVAMPSREEDGAVGAPDTFYESFRWMEENDGLDLRLSFDNFGQDFHEQAPLPKRDQIARRPSVRGRLSMTKKSFSRTSSLVGHSRPGTKDTTTAPSLRSAPSPAPTVQGGHARRKSRAMSLISLNKQSARDHPSSIDPAAAHYRDPSTRMTLREYMASPQKFDEALEYGFPSLGEVDEDDGQGTNAGQHTFLDDDRSSTHSTVSDPDSPKTPPILDKPMPVQSPRVCTDPVMSPKRGCAPTSINPREMTLRMTLTRSDLRAHEDQIYGWQKSAAERKAHMRGESLAPVMPEKEADMKENMEKHFAALDQENLDTPENGVMKRFWKRVRRT